MNLKEKLQLIESFSKAFQPVEEIPADYGIEKFIDGENLHTPYGSCFVTTKFFDQQYHHATIAISETDHISPTILATLGKNETLQAMDLKNTVFFDTETTGLSSGTGTYIFLAGFGYFEKKDFVITQFFLRDFDEEMAFLYAVHQLLEKFTGIISYNGKCFDWPLLKTRFVYSRINHELENFHHLDLVYTARRVWKQRLIDCSLGNIENHILNFQRVNDIPSYLIPQTYFHYLRTKNTKPLIPIFHHNMLDILSMVALLIKSAHVYRTPTDVLDEQQDLSSLAQAFQNMKKWEKSIVIYENLMKETIDQTTKNRIALKLSYCYKRLRLWEQAVQLWQDMIAEGFFSIEPYIELAKYYEHHLRDYKNAVDIVNRALQVLEIAKQLREDPHLNIYRDELTYRLKRITRKLFD